MTTERGSIGSSAAPLTPPPQSPTAGLTHSVDLINEVTHATADPAGPLDSFSRCLCVALVYACNECNEYSE